MREIRKLAGTLYLTEKEEIENAIQRIFSIHYTAKEEGLLALELLVGTEEEYTGKWFLEKAILGLVDGLAPEKQDALMTNRILAETDPKKQFICLLYKSGIEQIAMGEHIYYLERYISSLFPEACEEKVCNYMEDIIDRHNKQVYEEKRKQMPGKFQAVRMELPDGVKEQLNSFENKILEKEDRQIVEMLRNTDNFEVCSLLLAGTDAFRERILKNMSERLRIMTMEDVVERGKELKKDYEQEVENVKRALMLMSRYL